MQVEDCVVQVGQDWGKDPDDDDLDQPPRYSVKRVYSDGGRFDLQVELLKANLPRKGQWLLTSARWMCDPTSGFRRLS